MVRHFLQMATGGEFGDMAYRWNFEVFVVTWSGRNFAPRSGRLRQSL